MSSFNLKINTACDVTLSVWNRFHSDELCDGLSNAGLRVQWIGNRYPPPDGMAKKSFDPVSLALLHLHSRTHMEWPKHASMHFFDFFSSMQHIYSPLLWAFAPLNTGLIRKARRKGIPVILDVAIGHQRLYLKVMSEELKKLQLPFSQKLVELWVRNYEEEYTAADWLIVGSRFVGRTLVEHGIAPKKILVNHYGVDGSRWRECKERRQKIGKKIVFVYCAALTVRKGVHHLVQAWIQANLENAELWICGGGTLPWDRICNTLPDSIKFLGRQSHDQLRHIYSQAHVYVLPSLLEGLARSGVEAMAAGLPLIITEETGLGDFVTHGKQGWLVPSRNVDALAAQMNWCNENRSAVQKAGEEAYKSGTKLDFGSYGARCAAIAKAILAGKNPDTIIPETIFMR